MILYLIRHGQTDWNHEHRCQGFSDTELNATGRMQAQCLARRFSTLEIDAIFSSTLKRALETAETVARFHDAPVQPSGAFREINQGQFEGLTLSELFSLHADFLKQWMRDPAGLVLPGGESMREVQERAWAALTDIIDAFPTGKVIVVSHNLCNLTLLCKFLGLDLSHFRYLRQDESAVNLIEIGERFPHPVMVRLNDVSHLWNFAST